MEIKEDEIFITLKDKEGKDREFCDNETALAVLLVNEVCFINERPYTHNFKNNPANIDGKTTTVHVNCNDLFYWASSDAEDLPIDEIGNLYRMWKNNPRWGAWKWCCLRANLRPQIPIVKDMKNDGYWDAELEALPAPEPS